MWRVEMEKEQPRSLMHVGKLSKRLKFCLLKRNESKQRVP